MMRIKNGMWYGVALVLLLVDQISKYLALHQLSLYHSQPIFPGLNWTLTYNSGSAFGFLNQSTVWWHPHVFTLFGIVMSAGLIAWIALCKTKAKWELFALACILSGAIGNVIDRVRFGYVIDFIHVYYKQHSFPIFNIADSLICIGAGLLFIMSSKKSSTL